MVFVLSRFSLVLFKTQLVAVGYGKNLVFYPSIMYIYIYITFRWTNYGNNTLIAIRVDAHRFSTISRTQRNVRPIPDFNFRTKTPDPFLSIFIPKSIETSFLFQYFIAYRPPECI